MLESDIQDSVQVDEKTVSDLFSVGFVNSDGTKSLMTFDSPVKYIDDETGIIRFMNLDEEFLNAESTIYPCIIDPSIFAVDLYNNSSSNVQQSGGNGYVNIELSAGTFNGSGEHMSYVKVNDVDQFSWIELNRLTSAEFRVKAASSGYNNACTIDCYDSMINSCSICKYQF